MIEMLGVLAIIGVLSAGGVWAYSLAMESYKTNKLISDIKLIATEAVNIYNDPKMHTEEVEANITPQLRNLGIIKTNPTPFKDITVVFYNRVIKSTNMYCLQHLASQSFRINAPCKAIIVSLQNVPKSVCVKIFTHDWRGTGFIGGGTYANGTGGTTYDKPLPPSEAEYMCRNVPEMAISVSFIYQGARVPY